MTIMHFICGWGHGLDVGPLASVCECLILFGRITPTPNAEIWMPHDSHVRHADYTSSGLLPGQLTTCSASC